MTNYPKLQIYQGIIQYLLDSTGYDLKNIAALSNTTIKSIRTIYKGDKIPPNFSSSEKHLVQLYQMILELNTKKGTNLKHLTKETKYENTQHTTSC
ncbi:hypothetical protein [Legionella septentrionalis]|uniref:XRE family transcriptional regulator n=1 Tax=Legionella septentrionalis TaxID=2498109 RepID=A0A3S0V9F7_9GAMM|nr:hypothetical protein [Legionella septentrionalis]RUQ78141.1 hypothetical protein EKM59_11840 [Legionella septentrionalis]